MNLTVHVILLIRFFQCDHFSYGLGTRLIAIAIASFPGFSGLGTRLPLPWPSVTSYTGVSTKMRDI